jgi:two-component system cell cycle response regulator
MHRPARILVVDPVAASRAALGERLRSLGYPVTLAADGVEAAHLALGDPPSAVVADLGMPSISGVQLCRLLQAEPGTAHVPVVLRGEDGRRNRFWAEQAGAVAYVVKGRTGDLVRALRKALLAQGEGDAFFMAMPSEGDIRDRIAGHLDRALFEMVIASEVRKLGTCESFPHLFDLFAQFVAQVTSYRWLALVPDRTPRAGLHANPDSRAEAEQAARATLGVGPDVAWSVIEDGDAEPGEGPAEAVTATVTLGDRPVGRVAMAPWGDVTEAENLLRICARELGGPLQMALLVEESQRLATIDSLTGRLNRRAFLEAAGRDVHRCHRYGDTLAIALLDVDHFKVINDLRGHASGDLVLSALGALLGRHPRQTDIAARWGGEEFVVAMPSTNLDNAAIAAERLRRAIAALDILDANGQRVPITASIGVAQLAPDERLESLVDRADRAMYPAKTAGRNQVHVARIDPAGETVFQRMSLDLAA